MEAITTIIVLSMLIESVIETFKMVVEGGVHWENIAAMALGIALAFFCNSGLMTAIGIEVPLMVDVVITGVLLSRGSNFMSDLFDKLKGGTVELSLEPVKKAE